MTLSEAQIAAVSESIRNQITSQIALVDARLAAIEKSLEKDAAGKVWTTRLLMGVILAQVATFILDGGIAVP